MDDPNTLYIISLVVLVFLSSFFSATETAFSSLNRIRIKNYATAGDKRAVRTLRIADNFDRALSAVLIGNNIVNIAAASIGTMLFVGFLGDSGVGISTIVMTIVVLIFGEVIPKSLAKENPENFALAVSSILDFLMKLFTPIIWMLMQIKKLLTSKFVSKESQPSVTEEELKFIIEEIEEEGVLNEHESELVQSALEFDDITVSEILTPRVDVVAIEVTEDIEKIKDIFMSEGFSRIPVYEKTIDNIIGILYEKDFLREYLKNNSQVDITSVLQDAIFVPPKKHISELLKEIQLSKSHLAVVTDQYGGTLGIITLEDIIEELVGEIWDESDEVNEDIVEIDSTTYRVNPDMNIYDLFDKLEIETNYDGPSQSVSALALEKFEKIPDANESFEFETLEIIIEAVSEQRIMSCIVKIIQQDIQQDVNE